MMPSAALGCGGWLRNKLSEKHLLFIGQVTFVVANAMVARRLLSYYHLGVGSPCTTRVCGQHTQWNPLLHERRFLRSCAILIFCPRLNARFVRACALEVVHMKGLMNHGTVQRRSPIANFFSIPTSQNPKPLNPKP